MDGWVEMDGTTGQNRNRSGREKPCQLAGVGLSSQSSEARSRNRPVKPTTFELWNLVFFFFSFLFSDYPRELQSKINSLKYLCSISCDSACRSVHNASFFFPFSLVGMRIDRSWKLRVGSRHGRSRAVTRDAGRRPAPIPFNLHAEALPCV